MINTKFEVYKIKRELRLENIVMELFNKDVSINDIANQMKLPKAKIISIIHTKCTLIKIKIKQNILWFEFLLNLLISFLHFYFLLKKITDASHCS